MKYFSVKVLLLPLLVGLCLFALNWVLPLPALFKIIGDEKDWLQIVSNAIISLGTVIWSVVSENRHIQNSKKFEKLCLCLDNIYKSLDIDREYLSLIYQLDSDKDVRSIITTIIDIEKKIDNSLYDFKVIEEYIQSKDELLELNNNIHLVSAAYKKVFGEFKKVLCKWASLQNTMLDAKESVTLIGTDNDKLEYVLKKNETSTFLYDAKNKFLSVHSSQQCAVKKMMFCLQTSMDKLKESESKIV